MPITARFRRPLTPSRACIVLASLVGAVSCGGSGVSDGSPLTEPPEDLLEWSAPSLDDDPDILEVPTYDG